MNIVEIKNLTFYYGRKKALDNVSLNIKKGSLNLFIGHNGSGKSTTIKIILGFLKLKKKDKNKVLVKTKSISYIEEKTKLPNHLRVYEFLDDLKKLSITICDYDYYAKCLDLKLNEYIGNLSKGNRQKVALVQLLMGDEDILILDEPTNGLDDIHIKMLVKLLKAKKDEGKTIIISTHYKELFNSINHEEFCFNEGRVK